MKLLILNIACCLLLGCSPSKSHIDLSPTIATRAMVVACLNHDFVHYRDSFSTNVNLQQEYSADSSTYTLGAEAHLKIKFNALSEILEESDCTIDEVRFSIISNDDLPSRWKLKPEFKWVDIEFKDKIILSQSFLVHLEDGAWKLIDPSHAQGALQNEI